jgi:hypothetical protein
MMLSIRNSAATISQPLGEASASALWVVWGDKIGAFRWEFAVTVRYFVT